MTQEQPATPSHLLPATSELRLQWIASLGSVTASRNQTEAAQTVANLEALLPDYPVACFTRETLRQAARRFQFMPSYQELEAFLNLIATAERYMARKGLALITNQSDSQRLINNQR